MGVPDPQVETDHESDEEEEDPEIKKQKEQRAPKKKPRRPRHPEKRRLAAIKWAEKDRKINPNRLADRITKMDEEEVAARFELVGSGTWSTIAYQTRISASHNSTREDPSW